MARVKNEQSKIVVAVSGGFDKSAKLLSASIKEMIYIGDALYEGGNDFTVIGTGIDTIQVSGPADVKYLLRKLLTQK